MLLSREIETGFVCATEIGLEPSTVRPFCAGAVRPLFGLRCSFPTDVLKGPQAKRGKRGQWSHRGFEFSVAVKSASARRASWSAGSDWTASVNTRMASSRLPDSRRAYPKLVRALL